MVGGNDSSQRPEEGVARSCMAACPYSVDAHWSVIGQLCPGRLNGQRIGGCWNAVGQLDGRIKAWVPLGQLTQEVDGSLDTYLKIL